MVRARSLLEEGAVLAVQRAAVCHWGRKDLLLECRESPKEGYARSRCSVNPVPVNQEGPSSSPRSPSLERESCKNHRRKRKP